MHHDANRRRTRMWSTARALRVFAFAALVPSMLVVGVTPTSAHHSRQAFDRERLTSITGTVKAFEFVNPHAWIHVAVRKPDGTLEDWDFEGGSVRRLSRAGWSGDMLEAGDVITVEFNPKRDGSPGGIFRSVSTADGRIYSTSRGR